MGEIVQVSVSRGGVPKRAVAEAMITSAGLEGDGWAHPRIHGGPDQKVLIIAAEVIDDLAVRGFPVFYGALGENLTVRGVDVRSLRAGQTWLSGDALLELTKVRVPCRTLDIYGKGFQACVKDGNGGFYASVIRPGRVSAGAPFELLSDVA